MFLNWVCFRRSSRFRIGFVGQRVFPGLDRATGVEIRVGNGGLAIGNLTQFAREAFDRGIEAGHEHRFRLRRGRFEFESLERANLRKDANKERQKLCAEAGRLVFLPQFLLKLARERW